MVRRKQHSCYPCRRQHQKCDGGDPCSNCKQSDRECTKEEAHVFLSEPNRSVVRRRRKYDLSFGGEEKWISVPSTVTFATDARGSGSSSVEDHGLPESAPGGESHFSNSAPSHHQDSSSHQQPIDGWKSTTGNPTSEHAAAWPLQSLEEAQLFRYYITNLSNWFDYAGTHKTFAVDIPELARSSPALLNAILAFSAKQLNLQGHVHESVSLRYQDAAYSTLIPSLRVEGSAFEPAHMAAVLMLRMVLHNTDAEPPAPECGCDVFLGLQVFLEALQANINSSTHVAIFMAVLRLYIFVASINRKPLELVESSCDWICKQLPMPSDSSRWTWKAILENGRCVNYIYDGQPKTWKRWNVLRSYSQGWDAGVPSYFQPIFQEDVSEGQPFPKVVFAHEIHLAAFMYHNMARLYILNNMPYESDPDRETALHTTQDDIEHESLGILRRMCGAAICHGDSVPIVLETTRAISICGHLFQTTQEQEAAYNLLLAGASHFPGLQPPSTFRALRESWGWQN